MECCQMKIDILTLFPEQIDAVMQGSIIGRGQEAGLISVEAHNIRDYTLSKQKKVDDYPYGGGKGLIMQCDPLFRCHQDVCKGEKVHTILMSPKGKTFDQAKARELLEREHIVIVCGHYEGVDQRFIDLCIDEEISLGDFVLTGGEIAAMAVSDAVCRLVPGVLAENASFEEESHWNGLLEYPQYTRPEVWHDMPVPPVLLSGHHKNIDEWRMYKSLKDTERLRPDMYQKLELTDEQKKILRKFQDE